MRSFGAWHPDQYDYDSPDAGEASGVLPDTKGGYLPWPQLAAFSLAVDDYVRGAFVARKTDGSYVIYVGTRTKLYLFVGPTTAWTDVSKAATTHNLPDDEFWSFDQFGTYLYVTNANDGLMRADIEAGTAFADVSGSPPRARGVKTAGDQLFLYGLTDNPQRLIWSGRNDPTFWTPGTRDCDFQDFPDGGFVNGMTALELGLVLQETAIRKMSPVDTRAIYLFARAEDARGLKAPSSLVTQGNTAYYLSEDGFFSTDGTGASRPIGADQVDAWFQDEVNYDRIYAVQGAGDPVRQRVFWLFPTVNNNTNLLDHILCYDVAKNQWTHAEVSASFLIAAATPGYTLDTLDALGYTLDTLPFSLDARFLLGGAPYLAAFDGEFKLALFSGSNMAAVVETGSFQAIPGQRSMIRRVIPKTDGSAVQIQVGAAARPQDAIVWGPATALRNNGTATVRSSGLSHRIRASYAAGDDWTHLLGVDVVAEARGER